jgi:hypothetical protein
VARIKTLNVLVKADIEELYRLARRITGENIRTSSCRSCVVQIMQDVERALIED